MMTAVVLVRQEVMLSSLIQPKKQQYWRVKYSGIIRMTGCWQQESRLMIIKQGEDSIFVTADTLFSARLTDLYSKKDSLVKDTIKGTKVINVKNNKESKDSTNRYFEAYRNVRIFSDSMQAVSDSLFYSFKDSTFRLFQDPVLWSKENQITGDTVYLYTKNKKADKIEVFENSFMVNRLDPEVYNQIKSTRMDGYFTDG